MAALDAEKYLDSAYSHCFILLGALKEWTYLLESPTAII
jgi:hypothetical protein